MTIEYVFKNIGRLSNNEWLQIIKLSQQTRNRPIDINNLYKTIYGKYTDNCINHQLVYDNKIIVNCFVDKIKLYNQITPTERKYINLNYLTCLNRDLDNKYKGIGKYFLNNILNIYGEIYLKPANDILNNFYKEQGFIATNLKGVGNCKYPIYHKVI